MTDILTTQLPMPVMFKNGKFLHSIRLEASTDGVWVHCAGTDHLGHIWKSAFLDFQSDDRFFVDKPFDVPPVAKRKPMEVAE